MYLLDASYLYALQDSNDSLHQRAREIADQIETKPLFVIADVLGELVTLITYRSTAARAIEIGDRFWQPESPLTVIYPRDADRQLTWVWFKAKNTNALSYIDTLCAVVADREGATMVSFDKGFRKFGAPLLGG